MQSNYCLVSPPMFPYFLYHPLTLLSFSPFSVFIFDFLLLRHPSAMCFLSSAQFVYSYPLPTPTVWLWLSYFDSFPRGCIRALGECRPPTRSSISPTTICVDVFLKPQLCPNNQLHDTLCVFMFPLATPLLRKKALFER